MIAPQIAAASPSLERPAHGVDDCAQLRAGLGVPVYLLRPAGATASGSAIGLMDVQAWWQGNPWVVSRSLAMTETAHVYADQFARLLEFAGVAIIIGGTVIATFLFARTGLVARDWRSAYGQYRSNLGRGILLGLELLVGADIISTITAPLTAESVSLLGGIVVIRTFLSFSLETEIEGCWPWRRAAREALPEAADQR
jgi:uncharacterized membrane protein